MWRFVLTDQYYKPLGELTNAADQTVTLNLNKTVDTCSFVLRMDHPLANIVSDVACSVKAYRDEELMFFGPVLSAEEKGDEQGATVSVNAVSYGWILSKKIAALGNNITVPGTYSKAQIAVELMSYYFRLSQDQPNTLGTFTLGATSARFMPIMPDGSRADFITQLADARMSQYAGPVTSAASTISNYTADPFTSIADNIAALSAGANGFDFRILPVDNWEPNNNTIRGWGFPALFFAREIIGTNRPNAQFDWGGGLNNVKTYTRATSRDQQIGEIKVVRTGTNPTGYDIVSSFALETLGNGTPAQTAALKDWHMPQEVLQPDITDLALMKQLGLAHTQVRSYPRQTISFEPHVDPQGTGRMPRYGKDYFLGDYVKARAVVRATNSTRFDAMFRVWGVTFSIDENGMETTTVTVSDDG